MKRKPLVVLDFDGTIAPIAASPGKARIGKSELSGLRALQGRADILILTGRPRKFVKRQIRGVRAKVLGLHGNAQRNKSMALASLSLKARGELLCLPGIFIESKPMGFAVHYRNVPGKMQRKAVSTIRAFSRSAEGARAVAGRKCVEFLPKRAKTKPEALLEIVRRVPGRRVLYIGDDQSDREAILIARGEKYFSGALVRSRETRGSGVKKIARPQLFRFINDWLGVSR